MFNNTIEVDSFCDPTSGTSSQISTILLLITGVNIALSITATLENALILVALHKESSLNPPSKLFLRCLAFSDLCVGLLVQPVAVVSLLSAVYHRWNLCRVSESIWRTFSMGMVGFSFATSTAITVDRLFALLLGIRYRQVVTMKRARLFVALILLISIVNCFLQLYVNLSAVLLYSAVMWILWLITSVYCYARIYLTLRGHIQAQITPQGPPNAVSPLNLSRYKKTVSTAMWVFAAMMICYNPFGFALIFTSVSPIRKGLHVIINYSAITLVYLNSSLNPILYCWKITEVRHAVKEILRNLDPSKLCQE